MVEPFGRRSATVRQQACDGTLPDMELSESDSVPASAPSAPNCVGSVPVIQLLSLSDSAPASAVSRPSSVGIVPCGRDSKRRADHEPAKKGCSLSLTVKQLATRPSVLASAARLPSSEGSVPLMMLPVKSSEPASAVSAPTAVGTVPDSEFTARASVPVIARSSPTSDGTVPSSERAVRTLARAHARQPQRGESSVGAAHRASTRPPLHVTPRHVHSDVAPSPGQPTVVERLIASSAAQSSSSSPAAHPG